LQNKQRQFAPLVTAQQQSAAIHTKLTQLMAGDLQWSDLLTVLRSHAPQGVEVTSVTGTLSIGTPNGGSDRSGGLAVLNSSGKQSVGSLTITGNANDKDMIAAYVDGLGKIPGLAAPFPASVTDGQAGLTFTANVIMTTDLLGGRYSTRAAQGGH
jgi:Tfp pilus assembly protein PilN